MGCSFSVCSRLAPVLVALVLMAQAGCGDDGGAQPGTTTDTGSGDTDDTGDTTDDTTDDTGTDNPAVCGDGKVEGSEQCDDANDSSDDACNSDCTFTCGDGVLTSNEQCDTAIEAGQPGACPTACDDGEACTADVLEGTGCQAVCVTTDITDPANDDGCCPDGANANTDNDCEPECGNGVVEAGESCDTAIIGGDGACPEAPDCVDGIACTRDELENAGTCTAACANPEITQPANDDGCCPAGGSPEVDNDCTGDCGNGKIDDGETCDIAIAEGEANACPTSCDDGDTCTIDRLVLPGTCEARCELTNIELPTNDDGCCPDAGNANNDNDCQPECGNQVPEAGEECDDGPAGSERCDANCNSLVRSFRTTGLKIRDPHIFPSVPFVGCVGDVTNEGATVTVLGTTIEIPAINDLVNDAVTKDGDGDGFYDVSIVYNFVPFAPDGVSSSVDVIQAACAAPPEELSCSEEDPGSTVMTTATNQDSGTCLEPLPGTTGDYPAPPTPTAPCFSTEEAEVTVDIGAVAITLRKARVGAQYDSNKRLVDGMIRGFLTEADANSTTIEVPGAPIPIRLNQVLLGGRGNDCSGDDSDVLEDGTRGWWFYLEFTADEAPLTSELMSLP